MSHPTQDDLINSKLIDHMPKELCGIVIGYHAVFPFTLEVGDEFMCRDTQGKSLRSIVLKRTKDQIYVHYQGWEFRWDEWISIPSNRVYELRETTNDSIRKPQYNFSPEFVRKQELYRQNIDFGDEIGCLDTQQHWCRGIVLKRQNDMILLHYQGWSHRWDEWIKLELDNERLDFLQIKNSNVGIGKEKRHIYSKEDLEKMNHFYTNVQIGDHIDCLDQQTWIPAIVLDVKSNFVFVHYQGWDSSHDEWVTLSRDRIMPFYLHQTKTNLPPNPLYVMSTSEVLQLAAFRNTLQIGDSLDLLDIKGKRWCKATIIEKNQNSDLVLDFANTIEVVPQSSTRLAPFNTKSMCYKDS